MMTYLLDTDHLSLLQQKSSPERAMIVANINVHGEANCFACVPSFHEQCLGVHGKIQQAMKPDDLFKAYALFDKLLETYSEFDVLSFDRAAIADYLKLKSLNLRIKPMDLRTAAIALSRSMRVVTRNVSDFGRVPNLTVENWTR